MIFLFDKFKKLKGTVRNRHTISLLYERERNGLYTVSAEIPLKITDKKTVYNYHKKVKDSDFLGHYDREGRFQLHKIASVDIEDSSIFIKGVHLFFDEAKAGAIIQERRFRNSEIIDGARVAFDTIGWSVVDFDVSDTEDYIFYNVSPLEARAVLVETFGFEFDYWLDFDGKNIRNKQISVKREMGKDSNKRYNYGHNVLNIKVEQDYSEIYTAVIGRGKGEDLGDDAYGRRIEFTDVEWKTPSKPMDKPKGSRVLHDENATQLFGYHEDGKVSPRTKVEIFEDIEDPAKLLRASYNWLRENSVPKAVFSLEVPDGDGLDLGDKVHVIYRDIDLVKHTRVTKVVDDLVSGNRDVEFGDTAYFKTDRRLSGVKSELKRVGGSMSSRISRLKAEFDRRFDAEVKQWKDDFEQALIDAEASVEVMRAEMTEEFEATQRAMEEEFNQSVADAKKHADAQAEAKAQQVQDNLDTFKGRHEQLVTDLQGNVADIDGELADARADVSNILGRLTVVDGDVSGIKDSLTDVEGSLTNTKTQLENQISDARTELENSISTTRTELEGKIDSTEAALSKVGEDLGNAKTDLQKQLDDARAELDGLEVGGRNLLRDSYFKEDSPYFSYQRLDTEFSDGTLIATNQITTLTSYPRILYRPLGDLVVGERYTISFKAKADSEFSASFWVSDSNGSNRQIPLQMIPYTEEWELYSFTFTVNERFSDSTAIQWWVNKTNPDTVQSLYLKEIKLEKGNIATDWTPAPEDTEQKITNINQTITNIEGELSTKVEQSEVDALSGTVTRQGTLLTQTANEVSSKADKSVVDTLTGRVANAESSVTQNAEEIAKRLTKSVYDEDKKDTDAKITEWSNTATETAEGLERVIGRVSETEKGVETAQTRIEAEAGRIDGVLSRTSEVEGKVTKAQADIKANADEIATKVSSTEFNKLSGTVSDNSSAITQTANEVKSKVTQAEVDYSMSHIDNGSIKTVKDVASYYNRASTVTGALLIKTNLTGRAMSRVFIKGYNYSTNNSNIDVVISFYNYSTSILNHSYTSTGSKEIERVRLFRDSDGIVYILLNDFDSTWKYPAIMVDRFDMSYVTNWSWGEDWDITVIDSMPEDVAYITDVKGQDYGSIVTNHETSITQNAKEIALKANQTELDRVTGRVSTAETSITQNAKEIARRLVKTDYDSDKEATDAEITKWSNLTTETAEGLKQTISRVSTAEGKVTKAQADIIANADEIATKVSSSEFDALTDIVSDSSTAISQNARNINLKANQSDLNQVTKRVSSAESELSVQAGEIELRATKSELNDVEGRVTSSEASIKVADGQISSVAGRVTEAESEISSVVQDVSSITSTVTSLEDEVSTQGSQITQTKDVIDSKVWLDDVANINPNLIPFTDVSSPESKPHWNNWGSGATNTWVDNLGYMNVDTTDKNSTIRIQSEEIELVEGQEYTLSFLARTSGGWNTDGMFAYTFVLWPGKSSNQILSNGNHVIDYLGGSLSGLRRYTNTFTARHTGKAKIMLGTYKFRPEEYSRFSFKEPKLEKGSERTPFLNAFSNIEQTANSIRLSVLGELEGGYVTKSEFDVTVEGINSRVAKIDGGGVLKQSDITVTSGSVIIGSQEISSTKLASIIAVSPSAVDIITKKLNLTGNLNVKGQIESISTSAVKADFANIFAGTADIQFIVAKHLASEAIQTRHLRVTNAMAEKIIANSVMAREVKALSIDAVEANIGSIRSKILTSNVILSRHLNSSNALIDKIFSSTAMFERMMAKSGFVRTLNTVTIDTDRITIRRPDGARLINNGMLQASFDVQIRPNHASSAVEFTGINYATSSSFWQTFEHFYTDFKGSKLLISWAVNFYGPSASEYVEVRVRGFGGNNPIGTSYKKIFSNGSTAYLNHSINLGVPDYSTIQAYLEFRRSPDGSSAKNTVRARVLRVSMTD